MMRAICLHQPWASLMDVGEKTFETRGRRTHIRGEVAICATAHTQIKCFCSAEMRDAFLRHQIYGMKELPLGRVLCVVEFYDCMDAMKIAAVEPFGEEAFGDYSPGRFAWATRNLRSLAEKIPVKGKQGFFFLPADVERAVRAQI